MNRERQLEEEVEDITGVTGWMYTDLFVGLMVIFLATITFIPEGAKFVDPRAVQTYTEIFPTPLADKYFEYDYKKIRGNIDAFTTKNGFAGYESVARVQVVISYNSTRESTGDAIQRGLALVEKLKADDPRLFKESVTLIKTVNEANPNYFVLEFTFNRFVQVLGATP